MGRGFRKQRNNLKKQYLGAAVKYIERLEKENEALKNDPNTVVGQMVPQFRELLSQNKRLSVLAAAFIKAQGGSIKVSKDDMESFKGYALSIKWELPEGVEKVEDATEYIFSYELTKQEEQPEVTEESTAVVEAPEVVDSLSEQLAQAVESTQEQVEVTPSPEA